jgi:hypothetical protein
VREDHGGCRLTCLLPGAIEVSAGRPRTADVEESIKAALATLGESAGAERCG